MTEKSSALIGSTVGAILGAVAGYMFFTEKGRALRRQIEPMLEDVARELVHFRGTVQKVVGAADEGWKLMNDALGDEASTPPYSGSHQSSPF